MILEVPNERSSHKIPTPIGGGIAIVGAFYIGIFFFRGFIEVDVFHAFLVAFFIFIIGLFDDFFNLSIKYRLLVQIFASISVVCILDNISFDFLIFSFNGIFAYIFAVIILIFFTNIFNFLDGIDGYAASQSIYVGASIFILFNDKIGLIILFATLGFIIFNWEKASIFMGDAGSTFLGFIFAILILDNSQNGNIYIWMIIFSLFLFDAIITILKRYKNGEKVYKAHKKHMYQRLVQSGWSHSKVVLYAIVFNLIFLALLYISKNIWYILLFNIFCLILIQKFVEKRKEFT